MVHRSSASRSASAPSTPPAEASAETHEAVKSILNSRKCWRSIKGKEEPVWPPELEAALIEGLERYKPAESKSTRTLGRFPMRNKFVADYIYETTKVRRTPKQVGSRIQQLRDTNSGKQILKAISDRHYEMMHPKRAGPSSPSSSSSSASSSSPNHSHTATPVAPSSFDYTFSQAPISPSNVYVQVLPASAGWADQYSYPPMLVDLYSQDPRPIRMIDPTVTFSSASQTPCQAIYTVYHKGMVVHRSAAPVTITPSSVSGAQKWVYTATLVPAFWATLCDTDDPEAFVIHQEVLRLPHGAALLSVYYHFVNAALSTPPLSPRSSCGDSVTDVTSLSRSSSPNLAFALEDAADVKPLMGSFNMKPPFMDAAYASFPFDTSPAPVPLDLPWQYNAYDSSARTTVPLACEYAQDALWPEPFVYN